MQTLGEIFKRHSRPTPPEPTGLERRGTTIRGVRAVLFDIYGTLFVSASGDIGASRAAARKEALAEALAEVGLSQRLDASEVLERFFATIESFHRESQSRGIGYPEVDIVRVWERTLADLGVGFEIDYFRLAVEYEARVNPVWPMPGADETLGWLRSRGILLGIVSNAQFFTPMLFETFSEASTDEIGFDEALRFFSYLYGEAKPGEELYRRAAAVLDERGIAVHETLYVGNDMLNDVLPAQRTGFLTALFAGDARSLRLREDDERVRGVSPNLVLVDLRDLKNCLE